MSDAQGETNSIAGYSAPSQGYVPLNNLQFMHIPNSSTFENMNTPVSNLMTFKQFAMCQDESLAPNELLGMYDSYKTQYMQNHQSEFLENNKTSPIILEKFHPLWIRKILDEKRGMAITRAEIFSSKLKKGYFNPININYTGRNNRFITYYVNPFCERDSITVFGDGPYFETDLKSHMLVLTDIPGYISYLDITKFLNENFPLPDGGIGKCDGYLDIFFSPPKFSRGILYRQCYILFDNMSNRDTAIRLIKGKTIRSTVTTDTIKQMYYEIDDQMEDTDSDDQSISSGPKYSVYIIQAKSFNENYPARVGQISKILFNDERLVADRDNMKKIIEVIEKKQNMDSAFIQTLDDLIGNRTLSAKAITDVMYLYLRFVHGIDYYSLSISSPIQKITFNPSEIQHLEQSMNPINSDGSIACDEQLVQKRIQASIRFNEQLFEMYSNFQFLSRGYTDLLFKHKFKNLYNMDEQSFRPSHRGNLNDPKNISIINRLEENVDILLKLPSVSDLIPQLIRDDDSHLTYSWNKFNEQNTLEKKVDRWQCCKCSKQFINEEFVHRHLSKKHRDCLEAIREDITFERIIKPSAGKYPYLVYPVNAEESNINRFNRRRYHNHGNSYHGNSYHGNSYHGNSYHGNSYHGNSYHGNSYHGNFYHGNFYHGNSYRANRMRHNRRGRSNPYEKNRQSRDGGIPRQQPAPNTQNDIRATIRYDDL
ncbi:C2H2 Zn finger-containing protein [Cryptosporidium canis]|uniref:C2H2 Zn finger-containing protein n=1 Tax=Cryptosporidium canis TaxID=195482 RepID=A0A9D5DIT8_9CRYT|nr:C2H2 Zn finger-containing protein [Cryptosporidium canis]